MAYNRYEDMLKPARTRPEPWRLAVGIILSFLIMQTCMTFFGATIIAGLGETDGKFFIEEITSAETKRGTVLLLLTLGFLAVGPILLCNPLHGRSAWTLFGPPGRALLDFLIGVRGLLILSVVLFLIPGGPTPDRVMGVGEWLMVLPISLIAVFVQTTAEEIVFRGYLQTELAARFRSPVIWMILPSFLFATGHYSPASYGENAIWVAAWSFIFGIIAADLTARTGTLGAAIAFHFVNNAIAICFVSMQGPVSGLALYQYPFGIETVEATASVLMVDFGVMVVSWLAIRLALKV